jgi:putative hydrolase of HD superfamily
MEKSLLKLLDYLHQVEKLKSTLRFSKTKSGRQESSAEHSWRMALLTYELIELFDLKIDTLRCLKLALVHDLPEVITGDFPAYKVATGEIDSNHKKQLTNDAIQQLADFLPDSRSRDLISLIQEFEKQETLEAKFVKAIDKIESLIQYIEMGHENFHPLHDFAAFYTDKYLTDFPDLHPMVLLIKKELKQEFVKAGIPWKKEYEKIKI